MKSPDGATSSSWYQSLQVPKHSAPANAMRADVCVVGAGIAGLTAGYLLASEGKSVVVLDEGEVGSGQTGRTSAHLTAAIDDRFFQIEKSLGADAARWCYESHTAAINLVEKISREEQIDCDFARIDGFLFPAVPDDEKRCIDPEFDAARRAGFEGVEKVRRPLFRSDQNSAALRFANQARFHPLKYLFGLAQAFEKRGGKIYCGCRVKDVQGADPKKRTLARATIDDGPIAVEANAIVVATNTPAPINDWMGIYLKQASYRTYLIVAQIPRGSVEDALYWDTAYPYHYVRVENDQLLIGGEDHKTGQFPAGDTPFANLEKWARQMFPMTGEIRYRWSGQVQEPEDGFAFIGRAPTKGENVFVITGDSGMGLTHGTLGAMLVSDLIMGRSNPWEKLYDPSRKQTNLEFVSENANAMKQYVDLLTGGDVKSVDEIAPGSGAVMRQGMHKLAVYRDDAGVIHKHSALCTHLKCVVQWNHIEKTWDCPCHGSRFDPTGKVLMGPAIDDLPSAS